MAHMGVRGLLELQAENMRNPPPPTSQIHIPVFLFDYKGCVGFVKRRIVLIAKIFVMRQFYMGAGFWRVGFHPDRLYGRRGSHPSKFMVSRKRLTHYTFSTFSGKIYWP